MSSTMKMSGLPDRQADRKEFCAAHGEFVSINIFGTVWTKCTKCNDELREKEIAQAKEKEAIQRAKKWERIVGVAGIPERFKNRTLDNYQATLPEQKAALGFCKEYAQDIIDGKNTGRNAIFSGSIGTGKTHLAIGVALKIIRSSHTASFVTVQRLIRRIKDSWRKDSTESESQIIKVFAEVDLLILDEIGVQFGSEFEKNILFEILNERYEAGRSTLLLTNLTVEQVRAFLGDRIFDRMRDGGGRAIPFAWDSYRGGNNSFNVRVDDQ